MLTPNVELNNAVILVTGAAGFIGSNLVMELLRTVERTMPDSFEALENAFFERIKAKLATESKEYEIDLVCDASGDYNITLAQPAGVLLINLLVGFALFTHERQRCSADMFGENDVFFLHHGDKLCVNSGILASAADGACKIYFLHSGVSP